MLERISNRYQAWLRNYFMNDMTLGVIITHLQIRAARAMIGITQAELAREAGLSTTGLNNIEAGRADAKGSTLRAIQAALEAHGVEFTNDAYPGVRMKAPR
jgi:DNA-binding XRE family transcriptional regulator